ncbi:MAG: anaerobic ribonucleoside-triphosphate reductase activating protein [Bacilli bacterium]|nr:anaerobic ribonucleoside-triphosphate reductase activating protein [Bacilli bacterium]MBN2696913.1 anaerobic ribonucleoside-triphosphate reductase activating protein [Bacilli bacterium]
MIFAGIVKTSLVDYPGKIATVLFTPGCNYNCFYCHNRSLIEDIEYIVPNDEIESFLEKRRGLIDGVVITGGEPTLHNDLLPYFLKLKALGYKTKLDTNGSNPEVVSKLLDANAVDYFAVDYKAPKTRYQEICRGDSDPELVLRSIQLLLEQKADFEVRTTVIPQLSLEDLIVMAEELPQVPRYVLNPYQKPIDFLEADSELVEAPAYPEKEIASFAETLKLYQPNVVLVF